MKSPIVSKRANAHPITTIVEVIQEDLQLVEEMITRAAGGPLPIMPEVAQHLIASGGKRLRPMICLLVARLANISRPHAICIAAVSEIIHSSSLLHDDVVDETPLRRGKPAAPKVFGNSICVLMGDALMARALMMLSDLPDPRPVQSLARCVRRMAVGEILQLARANNLDAPLLSYMRILEGKTSALFAWCSTVGGLCPEPLHSILDRFGRRVGMAFQVTDDCLDYAGGPATTGKSVGADLRQGKLTLPFYFASRLKPEIWSSIAELQAHPEDESVLLHVIEQVQQSGGIEAAKRTADTLLARAKNSLEKLPASPWKDHLRQLADFVVHRAS